jgi:hypothetical protein
MRSGRLIERLFSYPGTTRNISQKASITPFWALTLLGLTRETEQLLKALAKFIDSSLQFFSDSCGFAQLSKRANFVVIESRGAERTPRSRRRFAESELRCRHPCFVFKVQTQTLRLSPFSSQTFLCKLAFRTSDGSARAMSLCFQRRLQRDSITRGFGRRVDEPGSQSDTEKIET